LPTQRPSPSSHSTRFLNDLTYYPSLNEFSDFFLTSTAELRANLTKNMFANLKIIFTYDAIPAIDRGNTDTKYPLGVGLNFGRGCCVKPSSHRVQNMHCPRRVAWALIVVYNAAKHDVLQGVNVQGDAR
jgi:hypothetical protein